jgi:hypothetical protein
MASDVTHKVFTEHGVAIPIPPYGWLYRRQVFRACRKRGGHFFHGSHAGFAASCCQCGFVDDNPNIPKGHWCDV